MSLQVLALDASNVEAIACLAADHFYSDQPELALRYYRRLLQVRAPSSACIDWHQQHPTRMSMQYGCGLMVGAVVPADGCGLC
jgi:cytochrome c-type biogenesis protein CcmH/NrfG